MADSEPQPTHSNRQYDALTGQVGDALIAGALPGEIDGFDAEERGYAAELALKALAERRAGQPSVVCETGVSGEGRRLMRMAIVNDDRPFLVDTIAATVADAGLTIDRLLHPVVTVTRGDGGTLTAMGGTQRESLVYLEVERPDARDRRTLVEKIERNLGHVAHAVTDWEALKTELAADRDALSGEGGALLGWLLDGHFTLLGHAIFAADGSMAQPMGIAGELGDELLAKDSRARAAVLLKDRAAPLLVKSNCISPVHRHAPLDLVIVPRGDTLSIHAGLWTSAALSAPAQDVPVLRQRLAELQAKLGFSPGGHAGKALAHALDALPHDLLIGIDTASLETLALTAMSLEDRPRPKLLLVEDALRRHLFAFVWLPRDELSTARRVAIGKLVAEAADGKLLSWSIDLGDSGVALIRYTFDRRKSGRDADAAALDAQIVRLVRGWSSSVEAALAEGGDPGRAARLALRYADQLPPGYRQAVEAEEAARDIDRLHGLADDAPRSVRLYRNDEDDASRLRLKLYSATPLTLSDAVPPLENFGFRVVEELSTKVGREGEFGNIYRFVLDTNGEAADVLARAHTVEATVADVLTGASENDRFNALLTAAELPPSAIVLYRALFRYLRQTGVSYGLVTVVDALRSYPEIAKAIVALFDALHGPAGGDADAARAAIDDGLTKVASIEEDRILRTLRAVIEATLRTNFFAPAAKEAIAFKFDSALVPGLPAPVPWREIFVYSPRVEGIHLRAGPVARGGLRWSDRRDDFRTEILGLMKAQRVKNAVIVPTGAKGGFFPKMLPDAATNRDAWLAEGTESYRIFIRTLLSVTDNLVDGKVVHPEGVKILDGDDPYFVVAADKGTAAFSDVANAIAIERGFWLGDAFASGGSVGYDHKAMGITAKGAWVSVQRHFAEAGVDVQTDPVTVVGCGDMSGDVFGNGMLLSKSIKLVAAFDHRHIFLDPNPDAAATWAERARMFALPRSSWADWSAPVSEGGGVHSRAAKSLLVTPQVAAVLGIAEGPMEPSALIRAILQAPVGLIWFGGIGTYVKAASEANAQVGDAANDAQRVDAESLRAQVVGEGANLGLTQASRIVFAERGGRINTDFIDNSAGVDCSDNEVNIKIALAADVGKAGFDMPARNVLLASMTDDVAHLVLEDNRLQTLALSIAQRDGANTIPSLVRLIGTFEASGRLDRAVEGLPGDEALKRRAQDGRGMTRPELAVLLATAKLALQEAIEDHPIASDNGMIGELLAAFPKPMQDSHREAILAHRLRPQIVATKLANRIVNRLGLVHPFELAEEEGSSMGEVAAAFVAAERLFGLRATWDAIDAASLTEDARLTLFEQVALETRAQMADLIRAGHGADGVDATVSALTAGISTLDAAVGELLQDETRAQADEFRARLSASGATEELVGRVVRLAEMDGAVGLAALGESAHVDVLALTRAFTQLGAALGLDWAQGTAMRLAPTDPWERLLIAGLARDFQQMRLDWLRRDPTAPEARVEKWLADCAPRVAQFRALIDRARTVAQPSPAMLAQIAGQARVLLGR
ncbi:glutamate dehydrogenase [Sphingomonas antarctica]|uniref:NAD-glutamate dehydrogenase domain-containing protein n=1 Tax=Sphingomonas antarctica TaxID=2040274 RepID=UPI0039EB752E